MHAVPPTFPLSNKYQGHLCSVSGQEFGDFCGVAGRSMKAWEAFVTANEYDGTEKEDHEPVYEIDDLKACMLFTGRALDTVSSITCSFLETIICE
jgi:hypothetical protein